VQEKEEEEDDDDEEEEATEGTRATVITLRSR
jgi:hypothetical protein